MREIKFRGLNRKTKEWEYGHLMYSVSDSGLVIVETVDCPPSMQDPCGDTINLYHGVIHKTVGEFTGLKDKNGKEIYEGDILEWKRSEQGKESSFYKEKGSVIFSNGGFEASANKLADWHTYDDRRLKERLYVHAAHFTTPAYYYKQFDIEVIGNIHENKDLLK